MIIQNSEEFWAPKFKKCLNLPGGTVSVAFEANWAYPKTISTIRLLGLKLDNLIEYSFAEICKVWPFGESLKIKNFLIY